MPDGPASKLAGGLPALFGFVRTSLKQSPLVEMGIEGPSTLDQRFPILAHWQYGLGKAVAFTSDARTDGDRLGWDREWAGSDMYLKFWEQVIGWALRGVESGKLSIASEYRDGKVRVTVDARDERNRPLDRLAMPWTNRRDDHQLDVAADLNEGRGGVVLHIVGSRVVSGARRIGIDHIEADRIEPDD